MDILKMVMMLMSSLSICFNVEGGVTNTLTIKRITKRNVRFKVYNNVFLIINRLSEFIV